MDWTHFPTFFFMALIVEVSPGPNFMLIAKTVPTAGRISAIANISGFSTAFMLHGGLSIFGFSVILTSSASLLFAVKLIGAAYLCYLGARVLWDLLDTEPVEPLVPICDLAPALSSIDYRSLIRGWREGFIQNCLNPKISMFYLTVFPQFVGKENYAKTDSYFLVFIHIIVNAVWFLLVTVSIAHLLQAVRSNRLVLSLKIFSGIALIGFGAFFALSTGHSS